MIYYIRNATKNFIEQNRGVSINGLPIEIAAVVEENPRAKSLDDYIKNIVIQDNENAEGFLLNLVPIIMRINVYIVNIDTSTQARVIIVK